MKKLLSANLQVWHLLAGIGVIALATTGGVVMAGPHAPPAWGAKVETVTPAAFVPPGNFRMATAAVNGSQYVKATDGVVTVISVPFIVPSGHAADIVAFFNAEAYKYPNGYCYVEFRLDSLASDPLRPGKLWVTDGYIYKGGYPTISAQSFRINLGAGQHTLYVQMTATGGDCLLSDRSLIVMANVR
jgi:hypothetical protein